MTDVADPAGIAELIERYNMWRTIYTRAGKPARNEPQWVDGSLWLRDGYPHPDWSAFVIQPEASGYKVLRASTERRIDPVLSYQGFFSRLQDAGKFIIAAVGDYLRIERRLDPIAWRWQDAGLDPAVEELVKSDDEVTYRLRQNSDAYCVMTLGDRPYSHLLPLTYDELTDVLLQGFPDDLVAGAG
jgi:hypothetical protein